MAATPSRILIVDDEPALRSALNRALTLSRYQVLMAADGQQALDVLGGPHTVDAVLLDVNMPGINGLEVCRRLRASGNNVPVLMLTAKDAVADRVSGLDAGADDYVVKPFALRELHARLRALLRRTEVSTGPLSFADLRVDPVTREVWRGQRHIETSRTEYALLEMFLRHPRQLLTRSSIYEEVWKYDFGPSSNTLAVFVGYLRRKTEEGGEPRLLHTVRGIGYILRESS